ncbi:hypothetical protein BDW42DRAFT_159042 [Aspergillus taichungensis]|uniref:Uncharacterized protein n=1 Tax=Aspergillus taichungensis TaxID=482145 RepID=A0A2J5I930_9EURO|nr:hypothetical protein BDW42DRAFT_159042 [Aspergillus taichungensis]
MSYLWAFSCEKTVVSLNEVSICGQGCVRLTCNRYGCCCVSLLCNGYLVFIH